MTQTWPPLVFSFSRRHRAFSRQKLLYIDKCSSSDHINSDLEDSLLLETSNELLNGTDLNTSFSDRRLLHEERFQSGFNIYTKLFRLNLINGLLAGLEQ